MTIRFRAKTLNGFGVDSPLKPFQFPGGEAHIKGAEEDLTKFSYQLADVRGASADDLFTLAMWSDVVRQKGVRRIAFIPYLPGARADRGAPFGAKVYADFINNLNLDQVIAIDPHSPVMPSMLNNLSVFPFERIIRREVQDATSDSRAMPYAGVIAPDKGAVDRATKAANVMGVPVYRAEKKRNFDTGQLEGFHMVDELPAEGKFLLVDDICDGGGTFIGLADAIGLDLNRLDLWVTHGIFSKGFDGLAKHFGTIHTTDSWLNPNETFIPTYVKVHALVAYLTEDIKDTTTEKD
jgi:ribose-phosphate pyrophosphokinase